MLYTKDLGIVATKAELVALLQFTSDANERTSGVGFRIQNGRLLAQATNGHAAVYHHSDALDGKGGKYTGTHEWQVSADFLARQTVKRGEEIVLCVDKAGKLTDALVRDIESGEAKGIAPLAGHIGEQMAIAITEKIPERPTRSQSPTDHVCLAPTLLSKVAKVARACSAGASRWTVPASHLDPVYIEVDSGGNLSDDLEIAAWIVVVMPLRLDGGEELSPADQAIRDKVAELKAEKTGAPALRFENEEAGS
jgi:hypothetical protein